MRPSVCALACLLLSTAAWSWGAAAPAGGNADSATLTRDTARCHTYADLSACYDAIRWNPRDPALLVALGDALVRAKRPADAIRNYRRAAALAPTLPGVAAKISAAEEKLSPRRAPANRAAANRAQGKRYSNEAPETKSH